MSYYRKHVFFCVNQRLNGRKCCQDADAQAMRNYAKARLKALGLAGKGGIRINTAGCMGRCLSGPSVVIHPEGVWYTYQNRADIDEIIDQHLSKGRVVSRLLMDQGESEQGQS